eukprot:gene851-12122_t
MPSNMHPQMQQQFQMMQQAQAQAQQISYFQNMHNVGTVGGQQPILGSQGGMAGGHRQTQ